MHRLQPESWTLRLVGSRLSRHYFPNHCLDLKAALPVWEALRSFASILLAYVTGRSSVTTLQLTLHPLSAVVAASFKAQDSPGYWFFITCSLLQGSLALISSTILVISFSGDHREVSLTYGPRTDLSSCNT